MKMYKITLSEKQNLEAMEMENRSKYNPVQDINGDWFISEVEYSICGLGVETTFTPPETSPTIE